MLKLNREIKKSILYLFSGSMISSLIGFINTVLLIKSIGLHNNGVLFLGMSYVNFFNSLFNFQSFDGIIKFLPVALKQKTLDSKNNEEAKNVIKLGLLLDITTAIIAFIVSHLMLSLISKYFDWSIEIQLITRILITSILFQVTGTCIGVLRIFGNFKYISILGVIKSVIALLLYLIAYDYEAPLEYYSYILVFVELINMFVMYLFTYKTLKINNLLKWRIQKIFYEKEFLKFTIYSNLSSTLDIPVFQLAPLIISKYLGISEVAIYKILEKLGQLITKVTSLVNQMLVPELSKKISEDDYKGAVTIGKKIGKTVIVLGGVFFILLILTKGFWLKYLIPTYPKYLSAIYLYFIFIIFTQAFMAQHPIFIYSGLIKENFYLHLIINPLYLILLIFLTKNTGLDGVMVSRIFQAGSVVIGKGIYLRKGRKLKK